jgi:type I restriction enzyme, S subunit
MVSRRPTSSTPTPSPKTSPTFRRRPRQRGDGQPALRRQGTQGSAAKLSHPHRRHFEQLPVALISLPEQQRIVGILDKAFEGITTAKANAEKNLQNARALFESHLQSVFADAWRTCKLVRLSDLATDITDGDHLPPPKSPTGVPFITIGNILKQTRKIDFADTFMVPHAYFNALKPNKKPKKGDVLYTVTGSFGIPVVLSENIEFCFQRHIGLIRPKSETSSTWLYYLLLSPQVFKQASDGATGTAQKTVSLKLLRSFEVPKVTPKQQKTAAVKLDAISAETPRQPLRAQARRAGGVEKVAAAPSLHWTTLESTYERSRNQSRIH